MRNTYKSLFKPEYLLWLLAGVVYFFVSRKWALEQKIKGIESDMSGSNGAVSQMAAMYAVRLDAAFRPSGDYRWMNDILGDGTDEDGCYAVAREMQINAVPFDMVSKAYNIKFGRDLMTDLASELDSTELQKFFSYIRK